MSRRLDGILLGGTFGKYQQPKSRVRDTTTSFDEEMSNIELISPALTTLMGPELLVKVSRPAGVLWISSAGPVFIRLLLNNDGTD